MNEPFDKLVDVATEQTGHMARLITIQEQHGRSLEHLAAEVTAHTRLLETCARELAEAGPRATRAVSEVKGHVTLVAANQDRWWKRVVWLAILLIAAAQVLGVGLEKVLAGVFRLN